MGPEREDPVGWEDRDQLHPSRRVHVECAPHPPPPARSRWGIDVAPCHVARRVDRGDGAIVRDGP